VPMAMFRTESDRFLVKILPAFDIPCTDDKDADIINALTKCNAALEELINYDPTQWAWMHNRWKSKPPVADREETLEEAVTSVE